METPHSLRLGNQGSKLQKASSRTGLKQPDLVKLALQELFKTYPKDSELMKAVIEFRMRESKKSANA